MAEEATRDAEAAEVERPRSANEALRKLWTTKTLGIAIGWSVTSPTYHIRLIPFHSIADNSQSSSHELLHELDSLHAKCLRTLRD